MRWGIKAGFGVGLVVLCAALPAAAGAAALSDSFAGRETVQGLPVVVAGSNVGAGKEAGEPVLKQFAPAGHSVWLEWEAASTGFVTVSTCGSEMPTVVGVSLGTDLEHLTELGSVSNFGIECAPISHGVTFKAYEGLEYEIVVDGNSFFVPPGSPASGEGAISLRIEATPPPPNDDFANAIDLTGRTSEEPGGARFYFGDLFGYNWGATTEVGEPLRKVGSEPASVWYRWTAPETGPARVGAGGSFGRQIWLGVYTGESLDSLQAVGVDADYVEIPAVAGTTYRIVVDGTSGEGAEAMSAFGVHVAMRLAPNPPPPVAKASVDSDPPRTLLRKRKVRPKERSASFFFNASEAGSSFRCKLDRRREAPCSSPRAYTGLAVGKHTFKVRAVDVAGNVDPTPAAAHFSIARPDR